MPASNYKNIQLEECEKPMNMRTKNMHDYPELEQKADITGLGINMMISINKLTRLLLIN